jgi:hypothetical protein
VERIRRSIGERFEFFPRVEFFPIVQAKTGLTGFPNRSDRFSLVGCREEFLSKEVPVVLWLFLFKGGEVLEAGFSLGRVFGEFLDRTGLTSFPCLCEAKSNGSGLTGFPCLCEAKSNGSGLTGFRNRPDRFGLPAAVSCVFSLCVCCGCWSGLAPRSSSTSVAAWTCQEKLVEVHE